MTITINIHHVVEAIGWVVLVSFGIDIIFAVAEAIFEHLS